MTQEMKEKLQLKREEAETILYALMNNQTDVLKASDVANLAQSVVYLTNNLAEPIGDELEKYNKIAPGVYVDVDDNDVTFLKMSPGIMTVKTEKIKIPKSFLFDFALTELNIEIAKRGNDD